MSADLLPMALRLARVFDELELEYLLAGSLASSIHGEPRSTHDVDFVLELSHTGVPELVTALEGEFYVDLELLQDAVARQASFQLVHRETYQRVDVFLRRPDPFMDQRFRNRLRVRVDEGATDTLWVTSAADIVLQKLAWFRKGGEVSDQQWRDVLGVLKANPDLDRSHLARWAQELGVSDLLASAIEQAGG